jgi:hypothetical protein
MLTNIVELCQMLTKEFPDKITMNPLLWQLKRVNKAIYSILLDHCYDIDLSEGMVYAASVNNIALVEILVDRGASPADGIAHATGIVKFLVERGANPEEAIEAAFHLPVAQFLVEKGVDPINALPLLLKGTIYQL